MAPKKNDSQALVQTSKIIGLTKLDSKKASKLLGEYRNEGLSTQHDLYPSLNGALIEAGEGSAFFGEVISEAVRNAAPSTYREGDFSDTIVLKEIGNEEQMVVFYASTSGGKAKLNGFKKGSGIMVFYKGYKKAKDPKHNDWADFGIEEFKNVEAAIKFQAEVEAA